MRRQYHRRRSSEQPPKTETSSLYKILANSALILTVITAVLYFHGRSLYDGYLSYWGLGAGLFPISTEDALGHGVNAYLWVGVEKWGYLAGMVLYIIALYVVVFFLLSKRPAALIRKAFRSDAINGNQKAIAWELMTALERILLALLAVLIFILLTAFAHQKGQQIAEGQHKKLIAGQPLSSNKFEKVSLVYQSETGRNENLTGYRLATSSTLCALCTADGVQVLPLSRIVSMRIAERVEKAAGEKAP